MDGLKGYQGIRTNPATVTGVGYVHPTQMLLGAPGGGAFMAVGTANGLGVSGTDCENDYDSLWTVYIDGRIGGEYFCEDVNEDAYGATTNPTFSITWEYCPSVSADRWLLSFGGVVWACKNASAHKASYASAGLETTGASTVDRNIDVKYTNVKISFEGNPNWSDIQRNWEDADADYTVDEVSDKAFNAYLAPLN